MCHCNVDMILSLFLLFYNNFAAARVEVKDEIVSRCGKVIFIVDVVSLDNETYEDFDVQSFRDGGCNRAPFLPRASAEIQTDWYEGCTECPNLKIGTQYLIAGYDSEDSNGNPIFELRCSDSLVSEWKSKYTKSLTKWVKKGNDVRSECSNCESFCTDQCS